MVDDAFAACGHITLPSVERYLAELEKSLDEVCGEKLHAEVRGMNLEKSQAEKFESDDAVSNIDVSPHENHEVMEMDAEIENTSDACENFDENHEVIEMEIESPRDACENFGGMQASTASQDYAVPDIGASSHEFENEASEACTEFDVSDFPPGGLKFP